MASSVLHPDKLETLHVDEERGVVKNLVRRYTVIGLTDTDSEVLESAIGTTGVPAIGDLAPGTTNVYCYGHSVRMAPDSPDKAYVDCKYANWQVFAGKWLVSSDGWVFTGDASLRQQATSFDWYGVQQTVSHTYPDTDPNFPGQTLTQAGQMNVLLPSSVIRITGELRVDYPDVIERVWLGSVNGLPWKGDAAYTWMCTHITWEEITRTATTMDWKFSFEFTYDPTGHDPQIVFIDPTTHRPPINLVANVGYKTVSYYPLTDFNYLFPI
ncbi:MAG: hypothetical protein GY832_22020 [Chloroflexi bacterium]|nr:hypothetical protein [Chloroflexota bacterium]